MSAISLHAQVQFHAKYPLFDNQSDHEFTFSYAILRYIGSQGCFPVSLYKDVRDFWSLKSDPNMITLTSYRRKKVYLGEQMLPEQLKFYYVMSIVYLNFYFCVLNWSY